MRADSATNEFLQENKQFQDSAKKSQKTENYRKWKSDSVKNAKIAQIERDSATNEFLQESATLTTRARKALRHGSARYKAPILYKTALIATTTRTSPHVHVRHFILQDSRTKPYSKRLPNGTNIGAHISRRNACRCY
jgi:hypothetical protein